MTRYSGKDALESLETAVNYNSALASRISKELSGPVVLDFGAGSGTFSQRLSLPGQRLFCLETDPDLVKRLTEQGFPTHTSLAKFPEGFFTDVYTLNVLEHIQDDEAVLSEIKKTIRPNGRIIILVPAHPILYSSFDERIGHLRRYNRRRLIAILRSAGFVVEKSEYFDSMGFFAALVYRLFDRGDGRLSRRALVLFDRTLFPIGRLLDRVTKQFLGKNLLVVGGKPIN